MKGNRTYYKIMPSSMKGRLGRLIESPKNKEIDMAFLKEGQRTFYVDRTPDGRVLTISPVFKVVKEIYADAKTGLPTIGVEVLRPGVI